MLDDLQRGRPGPAATVRLAPRLRAEGDRARLRALLVNLLGNALKFSSRQAAPSVEFAAAPDAGVEPVFVVRDNGVGFDMAYIEKLVLPFQRLHGPEEFEGSGIGLATVQRIVARHGGRAWAESAPGAGVAFNFTLS